MSSYKFTPRAVASPNAPQKPLLRKRARSGGIHITPPPPSPQWDKILAYWTKISLNPGKMPKPTVLAHSE